MTSFLVQLHQIRLKVGEVKLSFESDYFNHFENDFVANLTLIANKCEHELHIPKIRVHFVKSLGFSNCLKTIIMAYDKYCT